MCDVVFVTGAAMPKPDLETDMVVQSLRNCGVDAEIVAWTTPFDWSTSSLVVIRSPWDYIGQLPEFLGWARVVESQTNLVNPAQVLEWNSHKRYLIELRDAGVPVPPTIIVARGASRLERKAALYAYEDDVVLKPAVSNSGVGTVRLPSASQRAAGALAAGVETQDMVIQPFQSKVLETGETSLVYIGGTFSHAVRKTPAHGEFRVHDHFGGRVDGCLPTNAQRRVAETVLGSAPTHLAYARVDLIESASGPVLMELEAIEPELFLRFSESASALFAASLVDALSTAPKPRAQFGSENPLDPPRRV